MEDYVDYFEYLEQSMIDKKTCKSHRRGNIYCSVAVGIAGLNIGPYLKPNEEAVSTKKGLCLRSFKYKSLKELASKIGKSLTRTRHDCTGLEVIRLEFIFRLKIKHNDWLLADTCPQAANHCALF